VPVAQLIRRLRDLQMPLAQVRAVVEAPDVETRDQTLRSHLDQMERELAQTRDVVASLRSMLTLPVGELAVEYRFVPAFRAYSVTGHVDRGAIDVWCETTFGLLGEIAGRHGITATSGATYGDEFFTEDVGEVVGFLPVAPDQPAIDRVELVDLPASYFAITRHDGPFRDFDRTYGALGSHVAEYCEVAPGPIRELYLVGPGDGVDETEFRTEICWPIQRIPTLKG
jgi:effector-binding domain-containing protein/DNA-binding transcriptional MerR regulator